MRFLKGTEIIIILLIATVSILISLLDFIGALDTIPWLVNRIPVMILLSVSALTLYLISYQHRRQIEINSEIGSNTKKILTKIDNQSSYQNIIEYINSIWDEQESNFSVFFEQLKKISYSKDNKILKDFLREYENKLDKGTVNDTTQWLPWDVNVIAVDYEGKVIYHSYKRVLNKKYQDPEHPIKKILEERNGTMIWENVYRGKFAFAFPFELPSKFITRFSKIHFRDLKSLNVIVILQAHINIVPYVIKSNA